MAECSQIKKIEEKQCVWEMEVSSYISPKTLDNKKDSPQIHLRIVNVGDTGCGKTVMIQKYDTGSFMKNLCATCFNWDFVLKTISIDNVVVRLQLLDTAGQERYRTITESYFRGANAIMLYYDITERDTFKNLKSWLASIEKCAEPNVPKLLIGTKLDLKHRRQTTYEEARTFAINNNMLYIETSSKIGENVEAVYNIFVKTVIREQKARQRQFNRNDDDDESIFDCIIT
jgi:small GTP-binding protein